MKTNAQVLRTLFAAVALVAVVSGCGGPESRKARSLEASQVFLDKGNLDKARVELRNVLQIDPNDAEARYLSGVVAERQENIRQAAGHYSGTLDVDPAHMPARAALARIHVVAGLPSEAIQIVAESPEPVETSADLLAVRGAARAQLGVTADALSDAEQAVALDPRNERAIALYAGVLAHLERNEDAASVLEGGIEELPGSIDLRIARAVMAESAEDYATAETLYKEVRDLAPAEPIYIFQLSGYYERRGDLDAAEGVLRSSLDGLDDASTVRARLVNFLETRISPESAEAELKSMRAERETAAEAGLLLAGYYQRNNLPDEAMDALNRVAEEHSRSPEAEVARARLAVLKIREGDRDGGVALIEQVLESNPRSLEALQARAGLALSENRPDDAIVDYRVMLRDQPNSAALHQSIAQAHLQKGDLTLAEESLRNAVRAEPGNLDARIRLARYLAQTNDFDQANDLIRTVVVSDPTSIAARETAFRITASARNWDDALNWANSILDIQENNTLGHYLRGIALEGLGNQDEALAAYDASLESDSVNAEALAAWSRMLVRRGELEPAIARIDEVLEIVPDSPAIGNLRAEVLLHAGRADEARETLDHVIEISPGWWLPYRTLARSYVTDQPEKAVEVLTRGVNSAATPANLAIELATLHERLGDIDKAIAIYDSLIDTTNSSELVANNLAMLLATYKADPASLERASELTRTFATSMNPSFLNTFGWVHLKNGQVQMALPVLEKAVEMNPDSAIMRYHLGIAHLENGDQESAREQLTRSLEIDPQFPGSEDAREALSEINPSA